MVLFFILKHNLYSVRRDNIGDNLNNQQLAFNCDVAALNSGLYW